MTEFTELKAEVTNQSSIKPLKLFFLLRYESKYKIILWFSVFFYFYLCILAYFHRNLKNDFEHVWHKPYTEW